MYYAIIVFVFLVVSKIISGTNQYCRTFEAGDTKNDCNDGGCYDFNSKTCKCISSDGVTGGRICAKYDESCGVRYPCGKNGLCLSGVGHHVCICNDGYYGINCTFTITDNSDKVIIKPSVFYRIKSKQNEYLNLLIVSKKFGNNDYKINIKTKSHQFCNKINDIKKKIRVAELVALCHDTLDSNFFKVNTCDRSESAWECDDTCLLLKTLYIAYAEVEFAIVPYFITKIKSESYDDDEIYFDPETKTNRMGIKHYLDVQMYINEDDIEYQYSVLQFVVDDPLSTCLPLFNIFDRANTIKMYRYEWKEFIEPIKETNNLICTDNKFLVDYKFKVFDKNSHNTFNEYETLDGLSNASIGEFQESKGIISVRPYNLKFNAYYILHFQYIINDPTNKLTAKNTYFLELEIVLGGLKAIIKGSSVPMSVMKNQLLTLDATGSINPNENEFKQRTSLKFTWECDIVDDNNCRKYDTRDPKRTLKYYLKYNDTAYNFTLTIDVLDEYKINVGSPSKGYAYIIVYTGSLQHDAKHHSIKCIRNCMVLSNPAHEIYLKAENNFKRALYKWYYKQYGDKNNSPVDQIKLNDTSTKLLVIKKNKIKYGITYTFFVEYPDLNLTSDFIITTVSKPKIEECKINPDSGIAGDTLFTIYCPHIYSNRKTIFEYYQSNKNDKTNFGVLLDWSNGSLIDFKLTSSNSLIVKVINDYGAFDQYPVTATITECNSTILNNLFKQMKIKLKMKEISKSVVLISIVSDILHDNRIDKFMMLLNSLDQIPILHNCIFYINQFIMILHKVINDYNIFCNGKMEIPEILIISQHLYRVSISLFEYIKTASDEDKLKESDTIARIKLELQDNINKIQRNIEFSEDGQTDSNYYVESKFDNLNSIIQNVDHILKIFGKIEMLDIQTYERPITCENKQPNFKSCVLLYEELNNRSSPTESTQTIYDTIGKSLLSELLSKGDKWAITIINIEEKLSQILNVNDRTQTFLPIISLDIVNVDELYINNFITDANFDNYVDLKFDMKNNMTGNYNMYTIHVPGQNSRDVEFDKSIIVYKIDMKTIGNIFVTLTKATYNLRFAWLRATRPSIEIMKNEYSHTMKLFAGRPYDFVLKSLNDHKDQIHYIGLYVDMDENILRQNNIFDVNFSISIVGVQCLYWTGTIWASDSITIGPNTTATNLHCQSKHTTLFSGSLITLPDVINPFEEIPHTEDLSENIVCLTLVVSMFLVYILLFAWAKYNDNKNVAKSKIIILRDNYPREDEVYLVIIYTGYSAEAGTTANVCIQLHGNINTSRVHFLSSAEFKILQRFNDDWFIIYTPQPLGELQNIHIWHDSHGDNPSWYCKRMEVICLRDNKKWQFNVERWFSILPKTQNIEHTIFVGKPRDWKAGAKEEVELTLRDEFLWASVFISHPRSFITRCQRLSKVLCTLFCTMLLSLLFYEIEEDDEEDFLKFDITFTQISISIQSGILEALMTTSIFYCFEKSTDFVKYEVDIAEDEDVKLQYDEIKKVWWKKWLVRFCDKSPYIPAQAEKNVQIRPGYNYWLIAGWTLCITTYCFSAFYIMLSGLKFGQVKSMHWLMTLVISILRTSFFSEPIKIILTSCAMYKFHQGHTVMYTYNVALNRFRGNTVYMLQHFEVIHKIRESRKRLRYHPLMKEDSEIRQNIEKEKMRYKSIKENGVSCLFVILTSLCCIYIIFAFDNPNQVIHANNINRVFLNSLLQKKTMDLHTLKTFLKEQLTNHLNVKEFYNGIPIMDYPMKYPKNSRGWNDLYSSKTINGGVRLKQNRIKISGIGWTNDQENYDQGWIKTNESNNVSAWMYRSIHNAKYFNLWFPYVDNTGYILDLIGGKSDYKSNLAKHLDNGWLDVSTRSLSIEFKTYTPNTDCVTVFKIIFQMTSGLLYTVNSVVWTVPAESVFISVNIYTLTFVIICMYTATAMRLVSSFSSMVYNYNDRDGNTWFEYFWTIYECLLVVIVVSVLFIVADRWKLMERADKEYNTYNETAYLTIISDMCRVHDHVVALASALMVMMMFRAFQVIKYIDRMSRVERTVCESSGAIIVLAFHALILTTWPWYSRGTNYINSIILGRSAFVSEGYELLVDMYLFAIIISVLLKNYILSNFYMRPSLVLILKSSIMSASSFTSTSSISYK